MAKGRLAETVREARNICERFARRLSAAHRREFFSRETNVAHRAGLAIGPPAGRCF